MVLWNYTKAQRNGQYLSIGKKMSTSPLSPGDTRLPYVSKPYLITETLFLEEV
jgi:hypothetical protein